MPIVLPPDEAAIAGKGAAALDTRPARVGSELQTESLRTFRGLRGPEGKAQSEEALALLESNCFCIVCVERGFVFAVFLEKDCPTCARFKSADHCSGVNIAFVRISAIWYLVPINLMSIPGSSRTLAISQSRSMR